MLLAQFEPTGGPPHGFQHFARSQQSIKNFAQQINSTKALEVSNIHDRYIIDALNRILACYKLRDNVAPKNQEREGKDPTHSRQIERDE